MIVRGGYGFWFLVFVFVVIMVSGVIFFGLFGIVYDVGVFFLWFIFFYFVGVYVGVMFCMMFIFWVGNVFGSRIIFEYLGDWY